MSNEIANLEAQIVSLKAAAALKDLAIKLGENKTFQKVILDEFCEKECARFARMSGDPALSAENRADALAMAQASGHLKRWLSVIVRMGQQAEAQIPEAEGMITELRQTQTEGQ